MSVEIPYDLIKEVQIAVLKEANLSSYDPDNSSIPDLPSFESSISDLDPSPPYLRCKHCKGRLLRGVLSLICVFCGKQQAQEETAPEPINFKSTFGCGWLLQSLGLDESEIAGLPVKANESNRGQEEFPLSDFLDLEIKWRPELEKVESESNKSPLNFVGVNFDNFFAEGKTEIVLEEQFVEDRNNSGGGDDDFQVRDTYKSFENIWNFEPAVRATKDESGGDSFDGWEASFQSADDENTHVESKLDDPVVEPSVDLSAHMDAVFGSGKGFAEDKEVGSSASRINDWFQDDLGSGSKSEISGKSNQAELTANMKDEGMVDNVNNSSSMSINLIQDGQQKNEGNMAPDNKPIHEEDDSFDDWNDFTSSTIVEHTANTGETKQFEVTAIVKDGGEAEKAYNSSSRSILLVTDDQLQTNNIQRPDNKAIHEEDDLYDDWNDFASSTSVQDTSNGQTGQAKQFEVTANFKDGEVAENAKISSPTNVDWFQDNQWQTTSKKAPDNKAVNVDDDFFDAWNDFTSSTSAQDPSTKQSGQSIQFEVTTTIKDDRTVGKADNSTSIGWTQNDHWPATSNGTSDSKTVNEGNDLFDTWNDFTCSTSVKNFPNEQKSPIQTSEITTNVKDHGSMEGNDSFDWFQGDQGQTSGNKPPVGITTAEGYNSFDAWNGFTSSTSARDLSFKQSANHMEPSVEQTSGITVIASSNNLQNDDFGSFSQAHNFSVALSDQNGSREVNFMESGPSVSKRISDVNATNGGNAGEVSNTRTDDVEMLMSQMHDLSFMLASNLSVPTKRDEPNSFPKD